MGFCLFNNIAVGAEHALNTLGISRVGIFDFDVHHGNGTEAIFYERADVHFTSIHEAPWYPGTGLVTDTGSGAGVGTNLNLPLAAGADDASLLNLWLEEVRPAWEAFEPEIIFSLLALMVIGVIHWPISTIHPPDLNVSLLTSFSGLKPQVT